ncbi:MAG TPA: phospholipase D-like domain-containing protein [Chloroflexota bacterium]
MSIGQQTEIGLRFLGDGRQTADSVAAELAGFVASAKRSLDIAIYDCALTGDVAATIAHALQRATDAGVKIRIAYFGEQRGSDTIPPPAGSSEAFLAPLGLPYRPIAGDRALMHHKYAVRDAGLPNAAVWTGSTNWTNDSWSREENVILQLPSQDLAALYRADFEELWASGSIEDTGSDVLGSAGLSYTGQSVPVQVWFSPGRGLDMAHQVAQAITMARHRILIASPVLTVGSVLGALGDVVHRGHVALAGVYDATQMQEVREQWRVDPHASWKVGAFDGIAQAADFAAKRSTPYAPGSVHDYMHLKMIVADDMVFTGSYNFSHSGEENAENLLRLDSSALAGACAGAIHAIIERYGT